MKSLPHVVIVGGGFGGLRAAKVLKNTSVRITLIDKKNHHLFQPLLYQVATAGLSPADIATPIRGILKNQKNLEVIMGEVTGVDVSNSRVQLADRSFDFDFLVIATGSTHSYFGKDEWEQNAPGLKSIDDATKIRTKILMAFEAAEVESDLKKRAELLTFVIVGAGPTGVELAGSIAELAHTALASDFRNIDPRSAQIILLEAGPRLLSTFPEVLSKKAKLSLEKLGVIVKENARVEKVDSEGVVVSGLRISSQTVIWAAGVIASPASRWLKADADRAGRVRVTSNLSLPGHPNIFVIGDTASAFDENGKQLPGIAPVAMQQGKYVGNIIKSMIEHKELPKHFHYLDKGNLATIGRSCAIAEIRKLRIHGFFAWLVWIFVHIFYLIGFRNRLVVLLEWAWAYFTFQRGARLITGDAPIIQSTHLER